MFKDFNGFDCYLRGFRVICKDYGGSFCYAIRDHVRVAETNFFPIPDAWNSKMYSKN